MVAALAWTACAPPTDGVGAQRLENVYGADDRRQWYEPHERLTEAEDAIIRELGEHTVGMFVRDRHVRFTDPDHIALCGSNVADYPAGREDDCFTRTLDWSTFDDSEVGNGMAALCDDEAHRLEPSIGRCSGTLIAEDLVLTSGHCMDAEDDPETSVFVFNFRYEEPAGASFIEYRDTPARPVAFWIEQPAAGLANIDRDDVYHVVDAHFVLETEQRTRPSGSPTTSAVRDYAIVRLDRPVALPRHPAEIHFDEGRLAPDTPLTAAGFGKGLPLKIDDGARVIESWYCDAAFNPALVCNLHDGYAGASGSGLFARDGTLMAAHRGSASDFVMDPSGCYRSKVLSEDVPDTDFPAAAHHVAWAIEDFCLAGFAPESALCGDSSYQTTADTCDGDAVDSLGDLVCCERACSRDADCDDPAWGGRCDEAGHCRRNATCFAGELWERDACGRPVARLPDTADACLSTGDACERAEPLAFGAQRIPLRLDGLRDRAAGSCGGTYGVERVFRLDVPVDSDVTIALDGQVLDRVLYLRRDGCEPAAEVACAASDSSMDAHFSGRLEAGTYYVFADVSMAAGRPALPLEPPPELVITLGIVEGGRLDASFPDAGLGDGGTMPAMDGGCGCRIGKRRAARSLAWLGAAALGLVVHRRRTR